MRRTKSPHILLRGWYLRQCDDEDMKRHNVHTDFVSTQDGKTPVIVQRNFINKKCLGYPGKFPERASRTRHYPIKKQTASLGVRFCCYDGVLFSKAIHQYDGIICK